MIIDRELSFSLAQAVAADAASTDIIDLAPLGLAASAGGSPVNLGRNIATGEPLHVWLTIDVASAGGSTSVNLQTDADVAFGSATTLVTGLFIIPISTPAGTKFFSKLPMGEGFLYERYIRLFYDVTAATVTLSAGITKDADLWTSYVGGYTNAAG
jgi:hypothetical protein